MKLRGTVLVGNENNLTHKGVSMNKNFVKLALAIGLLSSSLASAYVSESTDSYGRQTSYSGPRGGSISGSTNFSGTSVVRAREQIVMNAEKIAVLNQVYSAEIREAIINARRALIEVHGAEAVAVLNDSEVIQLLNK